MYCTFAYFTIAGETFGQNWQNFFREPLSTSVVTKAKKFKILFSSVSKIPRATLYTSASITLQLCAKYLVSITDIFIIALYVFVYR